ncbi:bifunctional glutamate N-acetyltransferase/amino-acid acetyltransferase ArgJ [Candidatus Sumerlaeota bacterium]|nr:bifunctional glutamate N-acetyltransferase/amino-acid acetyltransferase ArgJ [Candidatus Sumerlaeota bacterium]
MKIPKGFKSIGVACNIKKKDKLDLALIVSDAPCSGAGFFTKNKFAAAPIQICRKRLSNASPRAIIANSGCANACTGKRGLSDAEQTALLVSKAIGCKKQEVLVASTGVIGAFLPMDKIEQGIKNATANLSENDWLSAARAIMTTDTVPKIASLNLEINGCPVTFLGMAKGAGMIHPNMATMLSFIITDANVSPSALKKAGRIAVNRSFNCVTVDGDTSTNDTVLYLANGMAENKRISPNSGDYKIFESALTEISQSLARQIAADGEGATKLIEVRVIGAKTEKDAHKTANAVATSNLVKTAIFGKDANWGRIVCAIGYSGADFDPDKITVHIGDELIFSKGAPQVKSEERLNKILEGREIPISIDLKSGAASSTVWTCDFSCDYVKINADYRT